LRLLKKDGRISESFYDAYLEVLDGEITAENMDRLNGYQQHTAGTSFLYRRSE
jgi:hypothetical protein